MKSSTDLAGLDPQARRLLAMVALGTTTRVYGSVTERRRSFETLMRFAPPPSHGYDACDRIIPAYGRDIPLRIYTPVPAPGRLRGLVYFHGGGLVAGSIATHDGICASLAIDSGCRVLSVGYRLAPEHPFPAAIIDALCATRWIARNAVELGVEGFGVGGDSGGGTLAAIVCQIMRRQVVQGHVVQRDGRIKAQVLLCPVLDFAGAHGSRTAYAEGFMLDAETMARDLEHYAPPRALTDPRISPLLHPSLVGMPRTLIHTAGFDPLRDEGAAYAARLREAGVTVEHVCHPSLIHHFYGLGSAIPAARAALSTIAADIARVLA